MGSSGLLEVDTDGEIATMMLCGCINIVFKAAVAVYFIHTCSDPIASDSLGELVSLFPVRSHFTDQITEVLEDHTATKWSTWVFWLLMHLPLLFLPGLFLQLVGEGT